MFNADYFSTTNVNQNAMSAHSTGKYIPLYDIVVKVIASKGGVELREVSYSTGIDHYELLMDGEFLNNFKSLKIAKAMYKDFAG